ncbi:MAG: AbrB/MazE/SpoVT family DNA-binding domain-containing protein [Oscillospiraceae bacterium]|nr:AbrB/MazE/SpoVT family DNA-binding domain-containing protein [Oscillospiraceae bacterium]
MPSKHVLGKSAANRIYGTAKVGDRGQIVIPKEARTQFHIKPGDTLLILGNDAHGLIVTRPEVLSDLADKIIEDIDQE